MKDRWSQMIDVMANVIRKCDKNYAQSRQFKSDLELVLQYSQEHAEVFYMLCLATGYDNADVQELINIFRRKHEKPKTSADEEVITCAKCTSTYVVMLTTELFFRQKDASVGSHIFFDMRHDMMFEDQLMTQNPSPREGGISMLMRCEECAFVFRIAFYQHKGQIFTVRKTGIE